MSSHLSEIVNYPSDSMEGLEFQDNQNRGPPNYSDNYQNANVGGYQTSHSTTTHLPAAEFRTTDQQRASLQLSSSSQCQPSRALRWPNTNAVLPNSPDVSMVEGNSMTILPPARPPTRPPTWVGGTEGYTEASVERFVRSGDLHDSYNKESDRPVIELREHHTSSEDHNLALQKSEHVHWCISREHDGIIKTCDGFKRHENEHEKHYVFMPFGPVEATSKGPRCALCNVHNPSKAHLEMHNIVQYSERKKPPIRKSRKGDFVKLLQKHKVPESDLEGLIRKWHRSEGKKSYSCGLCIKYFPTLMERSNHMCSEHFAKGQDLSCWDENIVVKGHLCRPGLREEWQRLFLGASDANVTWPPDMVEEIQRWLELGHDTVQRLASMVFNERETPMQHNSTNGPHDNVRAMKSAQTLVDFAQLGGFRQEGRSDTQEPFGDTSEGLCLSVMPDTANQVPRLGSTPVVSSSPLHHPFSTFTNTDANTNTAPSCAAPLDTAAELLEPGRDVHTSSSAASSPSNFIQTLQEGQSDDSLSEEDSNMMAFEKKEALEEQLEELWMELEQIIMRFEKNVMLRIEDLERHIEQLCTVK